MVRFAGVSILSCVVLSGASLQAFGETGASVGGVDWPAWRGADRTGVSAEKGLMKQWPKEGPALAWKATGLGNGYSTPSVAEGKIFVMGGRDGEEFVQALKVEDGAKAWSTAVGKTAQVGYAGPRSTPTVDGDRVYCLSSGGDLVCLDSQSGSVRWKKNLCDEFDGRYGGWGYAESPLIDGAALICTPGGSKATMVSLDKRSGDVKWKAKAKGRNVAAYSSPIIAKAGKLKEYVTFIAGGLIGVDAATGKLIWEYEHTANGTANIPTAIYRDGYVFSASGYGTGGGLVKLSAKGFDEVYFKHEMVNQHGGLVLIGKHLYGANERELLCLDFKTGTTAWHARSVGKASIASADGLLFVRSEEGPVALVAATPTAYKEMGRFDQPERSNDAAWPHPVISGGRLYLRDQDILLSYDVKAK